MSKLSLSDLDTILTQYETELKSILEGEPSPIKKQVLINHLADTYRPTLGFGVKDVEKHLIMLDAQETVDVQVSFSLRDILEATNTSDEYIVPGVLKKGGSLYMLSGPPKSAKSFWMYDVAAGAILGTSVFDMPVAKSRVLIFQKEEPKDTFIKRLRDRGIDTFNLSSDLIEESPLRVEREFDISTDIPKLKRLLRDFKPDLVFFDSFRAITATTGVAENSSEIAKFLYVLQKVLIIYGVTGIVIHHANKGAEKSGPKSMSGSFAIAGANDGMIFLNPSNTGGKGLAVEMETLPRDGLPVKYILRQQKDPSTGYSRFVVAEQLHMEKEVYKLQKRALREFSKEREDKLSVGDLCRRLGIESSEEKNLMFQAIEFLSDSGQICYEKRRSDSGKVYNVYWITPSNPWINFDEISGNKVFSEADNLLSLTSGEEIAARIETWSPSYRATVWATFSVQEQKRLRLLMYPPEFNEGDWVKLQGSESPEQVEECVFNPEVRNWNYKILGKDSIYKENDLVVCPDYSNVDTEAL